MALREGAFQYIASLEARITELEALSAEKSLEIERLQAVSAQVTEIAKETLGEPQDLPLDSGEARFGAASADQKPVQQVESDEQSKAESLQEARQQQAEHVKSQGSPAKPDKNRNGRGTPPTKSPSPNHEQGDKRKSNNRATKINTAASISAINPGSGVEPAPDASVPTKDVVGGLPAPSRKPGQRSKGKSTAAEEQKRFENVASDSNDVEATAVQETAASSQPEEKMAEVLPTASTKTVPPGFSGLKPPPGLPPPEPPLHGVIYILGSGVRVDTGSGEAILTASMSRRDMYAVVDETGRVVHRFEGTECVRFTVSGLRPGSTTELHVETSMGERVPECFGTVMVPAMAPPVAPRNISVVDRQRTSIRIKWQPPSEDGGSAITSYEVELSESVRPESYEQVYEGQKTECNITRLAWGTTYLIRVRALSALGSSPYSAPSISVATLAAAPSAPSPVRLVSEYGTRMIVAWDKPEKSNGSEISSYQLEMTKATEADRFQVVYNDAGHDRIELKNLEENTRYRFRVRAENGQGYSVWSQTSELSTAVAVPMQLGRTQVFDSKGEETYAINFECPFTISWKPSSSGGSNVTYHLEAKRENAAGSSWETVYLGQSSSVKLKANGTELYNDFLPGSTHLIAVSASNDRGLGPRSEAIMLHVRPVPPKPPLTIPKIKACSVDKGLMNIEFDSCSDSGGSMQIATIVELRREPKVQEAVPDAQRKVASQAVRFFESSTALQDAIKAAAPKTRALPPPRFQIGESVDAVYCADGRYYHAEVREIIPPQERELEVQKHQNSATAEYQYGVCFTGYENVEIVAELDIRPMFRKGDEVTAILYDTTPGAHAAGSSFVVKEHVRRLPGEIVSSMKEGYFVKFRGRGVATQKTNSFDVFGIASKPSTMEQSSGELSKEVIQNSPETSISNSSVPELPNDLHDSEWFEVCETTEFRCTLRGLKPGASYQIRLAAVTEGGGRGGFGPVHTLKMDAGLPLTPDTAPEIVSVKPSGRVELLLNAPSDDGGAAVTSAQVQWAPAKVTDGKQDEIFAVVELRGYQSTGAGANFESSHSKAVFIYHHERAGVALAMRYRVRNRIGWSGWSSPCLVQVPPSPPSAVRDLTSTTASSPVPSYSVSFFPPEKTNGAPVESYVLQHRKLLSLRSKVPEPYNMLKVPADGGEKQLVVSFKEGIVPGALYDLRIQAVNALGAGAVASVEIRVPTVFPSARPSNVVVNTKSHREFEAIWEFPDYDELQCGGGHVTYETEFIPAVGTRPPPAGALARDVVNAGESPVRHFTKNSKALLRPDQPYWFRVRAVNSSGASPFSEWIAFTMPSAPKEAEFASMLLVDQIQIRSTSTSADLAVQLQLDVLAASQAEQLIAQGGVALRIEILEKGSSVISANFEHMFPKRSNQNSQWHEVIATIGGLRANCAYTLRAQLMKGAVRGELSKPISFSTKPALQHLVDSAIVAEEEASKDREEESSQKPQVTDSMIKQLRRRASASTSRSESRGFGWVSAEFAMTFVSGHLPLLGMISLWFISGISFLFLIFPLLHLIALDVVIPRPTQDMTKLRKLDLMEKRLEEEVRKQQQLEQQQTSAATEKENKKKLKIMTKSLQHLEFEVKELRQDLSVCRSQLFSMARASEKRGLLKLALPAIYCTTLISAQILESPWQLFGLIVTIALVAVSAILYVVPTRIED